MTIYDYLHLDLKGGHPCPECCSSDALHFQASKRTTGPDTGYWRCFSCGSDGDGIAYLMAEGATFQEACNELEVSIKQETHAERLTRVRAKEEDQALHFQIMHNCRRIVHGFDITKSSEGPMIDIYAATLVWPAREWPDKFNEGKIKVSATFLPDARPDDKKHYVRVSASPGTDKARRLLRLRKGAHVVLGFVARGDKSYHDLINLHGLRVVPQEEVPA